MARTERDETAQEETGRGAGPPAWRRWLSWGLAAGVVVGVFVVVLPQISDMGEVWHLVRDIGPAAAAMLLLATAWNQVTYWLVAVAALPGLGLGQAASMNLASTAVANTVPAGGGVGVGLTAAMLRSWAFSAVDIGRYVALTGIWNNFVKLGMPIVALALLAATGDVDRRLVGPSAIGVAVLVASIAALVGLLRSEGGARRLGRTAQRLVDRIGWLRRRAPSDLPDRAAGFRADSAELLQDRWHWLTAATIVGHVSLYLVLLVTIRVVGIDAADLTWVEALAGFAFARLISAIPVTPGGVGLVELGYVGAFRQMGAGEDAAVAAVLVFRAISYLLPIPLGAVAYVLWARADGRDRDAAPSAVDDRVGAGGGAS